jgi:hypothetical protein
MTHPDAHPVAVEQRALKPQAVAVVLIDQVLNAVLVIRVNKSFERNMTQFFVSAAEKFFG